LVGNTDAFSLVSCSDPCAFSVVEGEDFSSDA
jgi:hypothetical protein